MAHYTFPCEFCEQTIGTTSERVGEDTACPHCGRTVTIPRPKANLRLRGRASAKKRTAKDAPVPMENLSNLTETSAFGGERAEYQARTRRRAALRQTLVGIGLLASLAAVGYAGWRVYDGQQQRKRRTLQVAEEGRLKLERRRAYWREIAGMNRKARGVSPNWTLTDEDGFALWLVINTLEENPRLARERFEVWVRADAELYGLCSQQFRRINSAADIEAAQQTLVGAALGLAATNAAPVAILRQFSEVAEKCLEMEAANDLRHPD